MYRRTAAVTVTILFASVILLMLPLIGAAEHQGQPLASADMAGIRGGEDPCYDCWWIRCEGHPSPCNGAEPDPCEWVTEQHKWLCVLRGEWMFKEGTYAVTWPECYDDASWGWVETVYGDWPCWKVTKCKDVCSDDGSPDEYYCLDGTSTVNAGIHPGCLPNVESNECGAPPY